MLLLPWPYPAMAIYFGRRLPPEANAADTTGGRSLPPDMKTKERKAMNEKKSWSKEEEREISDVEQFTQDIFFICERMLRLSEI